METLHNTQCIIQCNKLEVEVKTDLIIMTLHDITYYYMSCNMRLET